MSGHAFGLSAMDQPLEDFEDVLLNPAQVAKRGNMALSTYLELPPGLRPASRWSSDVARWAKSLRAGEPGWRRR